jgi:hypothetical protein
MKKIVFKTATLCAFALILLSSCGSKVEETVVPDGMQLVDLSKYGKPFTFLCPDSSTSKGSLIITEQNYMLEVRSGKSFGLVFEEGEGNMEQLKTDLKGDDVNKFKRFIADEPSLLVWESEITAPEFHLYAIVTIGNAKYVVKDLNATDNEPFTEADIKKMMDAVKSMKEKPKVEA